MESNECLRRYHYPCINTNRAVSRALYHRDQSPLPCLIHQLSVALALKRIKNHELGSMIT